MFLGEQGSDTSLSNIFPLFIYFDSRALYLLFPQLDFPGQTRPWDCPAEYEAPGAFLSPIVLIIQATVFNLQTCKVKLGTAVTLEGDSIGSNNQNTVIEAVM